MSERTLIDCVHTTSNANRITVEGCEHSSTVSTHYIRIHLLLRQNNMLFRVSFRFDEDIHHVELDYPRDMSIWRGIGYHIDAAFQYKDGKLRICFDISSIKFILFKLQNHIFSHTVH